MEKPIEVTRDMLAQALTEFYLTVREGTGYLRGQIANPVTAADALHATLSRIAAERRPDRDDRSAVSDETNQRIVSFDLMPKEPDYYFVLTEALKEFAARQRAEAADLDEADAASRIRWADTADEALEQIEEALSTPATIEGIVADSIEKHGQAALAQLDAKLGQPHEITGQEPGSCRG